MDALGGSMIPIGILLFSIVFIFTGIKQWRSSSDLLRTGTHTSAQIMGFEEKWSSSSGNFDSAGSSSRTTYYPIVRFNGPRGVVETTLSIGTSWKVGNVGDVRAICYDPEDPTNVILTDSSIGSGKGLGVIFAIFGGIAGTVAIVWLFLSTQFG